MTTQPKPVRQDDKQSDTPVIRINGSPVINTWSGGASYPKIRGT